MRGNIQNNAAYVIHRRALTWLIPLLEEPLRPEATMLFLPLDLTLRGHYIHHSEVHTYASVKPLIKQLQDTMSWQACFGNKLCHSGIGSTAHEMKLTAVSGQVPHLMGASAAARLPASSFASRSTSDAPLAHAKATKAAPWTSTHSPPQEHEFDAVLVGGGPNSLRLLACLQNASLRVVAFERRQLGHTISAEWYEGSVTHSPREKLAIGGIEPTECTRCLDDVWQDHFEQQRGHASVATPCVMDGGRRRHCARDQLVGYINRVQQTLRLPVRLNEAVTRVEPIGGSKAAGGRGLGGLYRVVTTAAEGSDCTEAGTGSTALPPTPRQPSNSACQAYQEYRAARVILAMGASSSHNRLKLPAEAQQHVADRLGAPELYVGRQVLVVGNGPSGMESAVRACNYGAAHVTLVTRGATFTLQYRGANVYLKASYTRLQRLHAAGRLSIMSGAMLRHANGTHAQLLVNSHTVAVPAERIIAAVGFHSDRPLIDSMSFKSSALNPRTLETALPGVYNLGLSGVAPWVRSSRGLLKTAIEDSIADVDKICRAVRTATAEQREAAAGGGVGAASSDAGGGVVAASSDAGVMVSTASPNAIGRRSVDMRSAGARTGVSGSTAAAGATPSPAFDCSAMVTATVDVPPIRSPQAVHSALARRFYNTSIVEIGTRNGDGIDCFARVASAATAVEISTAYCTRLRERSAASGRGFNVTCADYRASSVLDADFITFWSQLPHMTNAQVLRHIRGEVQRGRVRASAVAVPLFDVGGAMNDCASWEMLQPLAAWHEPVAFDETELCRRRHPSNAHGKHASQSCARARGTFIIAGIPIPASKSEELDFDRIISRGLSAGKTRLSTEACMQRLGSRPWA